MNRRHALRLLGASLAVLVVGRSASGGDAPGVDCRPGLPPRLAALAPQKFRALSPAELRRYRQGHRGVAETCALPEEPPEVAASDGAVIAGPDGAGE